MVVPKLPSSCIMATRLMGTFAFLAISNMLLTVRVAMALPLGCMRNVYLSPPSVRLSATAAKRRKGMRFFSVTCRTENATRLEKGPMTATAPWSMSREASELPSSTLFWVSPGRSVIFAPPSDLTPPVALISSVARVRPLRASPASKARGPVTGRR